VWRKKKSVDFLQLSRVQHDGQIELAVLGREVIV
jgi:hypothetical protein